MFSVFSFPLCFTVRPILRRKMQRPQSVTHDLTAPCHLIHVAQAPINKEIRCKWFCTTPHQTETHTSINFARVQESVSAELLLKTEEMETLEQSVALKEDKKRG